jgi:hypothetical protein
LGGPFRHGGGDRARLSQAATTGARKRNKNVAIKHGYEGAWERILLWHGWRVVGIGFPSWRTGPPLFPSCLALIGALDRDTQQPFCYASSDAWRKRDVKSSLLSRLPRPVLQALLVVLEKVFALRRKKAVYPFPYNIRTHTISLPAQIERELRRLVSTGKKVEAMKRVISLTGAGLRVSKDYVDTLAQEH